MRKYLFIVFSLSVFLLNAQPSHTPLVWLRADSVSAQDIVWRDVSGHGMHGSPSTGNLPVLTAQMNYNPCFQLNGESFRLDSFPASQHHLTAIIVYQVQDTVPEYGLWSVPLEEGKNVGLTTRRIISEKTQIKYADINQTGGVINSLSQNWKTIAGENNFTVNIGYADSLSFSGKLSEFLLFDGSIADSVLIRYISYLGVKYGITLYQTDYLNSKGEMIWNYTDYPDYSYSIGGLGRDSAMGLNQKQSILLDGRVRVGLERPAIDNFSNQGSLPEDAFMLWGFDSAMLLQAGTIRYEEEELTIYGAGLYQTYGKETSLQNIFIEVDGSGWNGDIRNYALVIDRSGSGTYPSGATEIYYADYVDSNHVLYFTCLHWDSDRNGTDRFGFAYRPLPQSASQGSEHKTGTLGKSFQENSGNQETDIKMGSNRYRLYPNPNRGHFRLDIHYEEPSDVSVMIYSPDGKLIKSFSGSSQSAYSFEESLPARGHYLIDILGAGERKSLKMIVQ